MVVHDSGLMMVRSHIVAGDSASGRSLLIVIVVGDDKEGEMKKKKDCEKGRLGREVKNWEERERTRGSWMDEESTWKREKIHPAIISSRPCLEKSDTNALMTIYGDERQHIAITTGAVVICKRG
ncbi:hypothetical protein ACLOJK_005818 [Asimina triloba]